MEKVSVGNNEGYAPVTFSPIQLYRCDLCWEETYCPKTHVEQKHRGW